MAENKKGFVLYADLIHTVGLMPDDKAGSLFKHILSYVNDENPTADDMLIKLVFEPIKQQLKRDLKKYEAKVTQCSDAGKRSAALRKDKRKQRPLTTVTKRITNPTVKDNVKVKDNVTVKDTDSIYHIEDAYEFLKENETAEIEVFEMQQKKSFVDFNLFVKYFNNTVIKEQMEWKPKVLLARLRMLNDNWDKSPKKSDEYKNPMQTLKAREKCEEQQK